ncbi:MAG TPA: hypothetical protein PLW93_02040 [Candidatus Absconditabacterales bacterium]|nr:hypothetical protein [Candidatus Absconditabacterales bacterium]
MANYFDNLLLNKRYNSQDFQTGLLSAAEEAKKTNPELFNKLMNLNNLYNSEFAPTAKAINDVYSAYNTQLNTNAGQLQDISTKVGADILGRLDTIQKGVEQQYGPEGELKTATDKYYNQLFEDLSQKQARENIYQTNEAIAKGIAPATARNITAFNQNPYYDQFLKAKANQVAQLDNLYKTYNSYLQNFLQAYGNTQDKYLVDLYKSLFNAREQVGLQLLNQQQSLLGAQLQNQIAKTKTVVPTNQATTNTKTNTPEIKNALNAANVAVDAFNRLLPTK